MNQMKIHLTTVQYAEIGDTLESFVLYNADDYGLDAGEIVDEMDDVYQWHIQRDLPMAQYANIVVFQCHFGQYVEIVI